MVRAVLAALALTAAAALAACTAETPKRCREVCARQAECQDKTKKEDTHFDEGECIAACAALERDRETQSQVEAHAECIAAAQGCPAVLDCP